MKPFRSVISFLLLVSLCFCTFASTAFAFDDSAFETPSSIEARSSGGISILAETYRSASKTFSISVNNSSGDYLTTAKITVKGSYSQVENSAVVNSASCSFTKDPSSFSADITTKSNYAIVKIIYKNGVTLAKYKFTLATNGTLTKTKL